MDESSRTALICGISGQDGAYLAEFLLTRGYRVVGTSRDAHMNSFGNLQRLGVRNQVELTSMAVNDFRSVIQTLDHYQPNEIYNLAGQSSVGLSFDQPVDTLESISRGTLNLLEAIRFLDRQIRFYNAGSSECFGNTSQVKAVEETAFRPCSPYAVAKAASFWQVTNYREAYSLYACSGILFNHESPLRPERFVTQKIIQAVSRIVAGSGERLTLGNLDIQRDWGWAPEYVEAMWMMLQQEVPEDFVIATGETHSLKYFVVEAFAAQGLYWREYVDYDSGLTRPLDLSISRANPTKASKRLGWSAKTRIKGVIRGMTAAAQGREQGV